MPGLSEVVELAAGRKHSCALRADGAVLCWGGNPRGQLGFGPTGPLVMVETPSKVELGPAP